MAIPAQAAGRLELLINHFLRLDPEACQRLKMLVGSIIAVDVCFGPLNEDSPHVKLYFIPDHELFRVTTENTRDPNVVIRGTPLSLIRQLYQDGRQGTVDDLEIQGDLSLAKTFQDLIGGVHIDWEEQLAHKVGDLPAHQVGNTVRWLRDWTNQSLRRLVQNTVEYFHYEACDLPPAGTLNNFMDDVDDLRSDAERLEARIQRLQHALTSTPSGRRQRTRSQPLTKPSNP